MKKFKNIADFKSEQQRLKIQQLELEKEMTNDWKNVKSSLAPGNVAKQFYHGIFHNPENNEDKAIAGKMGKAISKFAMVVAMKKIGKWFMKKSSPGNK